VKNDRRSIQEYQDICRTLRYGTTQRVPNETPTEKLRRQEALRKDFQAFCNYYFAEYCKSPFGWFHLKAEKAITANPDVFCVLEWPREHAKSVFANLLMPMWLMARGELTGMVTVSANQDKASTLLSDVQAQLEHNALWENDYGSAKNQGNWSEDHFITNSGIGFWAFGRGQSPRGIRAGAQRPNYCNADDLDDKTIVRNIVRVREVRDWLMEDLYGALGLKGARFVVSGNRIHKESILAHVVGDIEETDPKRDGITHIKVYALENPKTHRKDYNGTPAWHQNHTREAIMNRRARIGERAWRREYFHEHTEEGIVYGDPSWKNTQASDYKAVVAVGSASGKLYIISSFCRQSSIAAMAKEYYTIYHRYADKARYYIEGGLVQDILYRDEFTRLDQELGFILPIRIDTRKKGDKYTRIENLTPLFERGMVYFNEANRSDSGMQALVMQLLAFPAGNDDGPDALHGAISYIQNTGRAARFKPRLGKYTRNER
jgi:predicted phage terminase large subunit-like protein